ncbi:c-type cytochrome [Cognatishimia activa]|uniref:Cytochrome c556 n=1 Tax=Cognatishimia activa TaxID=1715691 RepID=A0A0P1J9T8_9RHOB|nr:cytochrome c [Cognatishimia activa]MEE2944691.1 cytochrome c [Pseudomonadota bacterium]CUI72711.1 Cytochrome c556 [Cognatishimia activa]CUK26629.1 Cytochrome c556 [Cognatishimia activa]
MGKYTLIASCALAAAATFASADDVKKRTAAMDQIRMGAATLVPVIKGDKEFDAQVADLALRMTYAGALAFEGKFPEGSTSKGANPAIWENKADFDSKVLEFISNAEAAVAMQPNDLLSLQSAYQPLLKNCAACHKAYRIKN